MTSCRPMHIGPYLFICFYRYNRTASVRGSQSGWSCNVYILLFMVWLLLILIAFVSALSAIPRQKRLWNKFQIWSRANCSQYFMPKATPSTKSVAVIPNTRWPKTFAASGFLPRDSRAPWTRRSVPVTTPARGLMRFSSRRSLSTLLSRSRDESPW